MSRRIRPKTRGILEMLLCAFLWSIAGLFIKLVNGNAFVIAGFRGLFAGLTTLTYMIIAKIPFKLNKKSITTGIFMCILFIAFVTSNKLTTAANAIVLQFTTPLWLMLYNSIILKTKLKKNDTIAVLFSLIGITLCFLDKMEGGYLLGNIVAIFAGLMMGVMYVCLGTSNGEDRISGTLLGHLFTAIVGIPCLAFTENHLNSTAFLCLIILGVVQLGIPYILLNFASQTCPPLACSLLGAVEPLFNPIWVALFANEIPGILAIIGCIIVIASVTCWCISDINKN
ncbi:MAG: DMT family transporter [Bacillota bacterium]|nr:DMT family transporter [Bacillota bacterium]